MLTTTQRDTFLNTLDGNFLALFKSLIDMRAGTFVEADYTGYGTRPALTLGSAGNTSPVGGRQRANSVAVTFPENTGSSQDVIGYAVISTSSGAGTVRAMGLVDDDAPIYGTADDTGDLITAPAHGLVTDQRVFVQAEPGALLPAGLSENVAYFVLASGLTADAFKLSTTSGGAAVNITAKGAALFIPYKALTVVNSATPEFAIGTILIQL